MSEARMEKHEAVEVRIIWGEVLCFVHSVVVFYKCGDLHGMRHAVLDDGAKRIGSRAFWQREFVIAVLHAFRSNHDDVEFDSWEDVCQLKPYISR